MRIPLLIILLQPTLNNLLTSLRVTALPNHIPMHYIPLTPRINIPHGRAVVLAQENVGFAAARYVGEGTVVGYLQHYHGVYYFAPVAFVYFVSGFQLSHSANFRREEKMAMELWICWCYWLKCLAKRHFNLTNREEDSVR